MRYATFFLAALYLFFMPMPGHAQLDDTVKVVSIEVDADPVNPVKFGLPINLSVNGDPGNTDDHISAATLPHFFDPGDHVTIDSVRLTGGLADNPIFFGCFHNDEDNLGVIGFIMYFTDYIIPGESGLIGTLWFTLDANAPDHVIDIDSGYYPDAGEFILTNANGVTVYPAFEAGTITVNAAQVPALEVTPLSLTFDATVGGSDPASQSFDVSNVGYGDMAWTATEDAGWFSLSETSGSAPPTATVDVSVSISGLTADTYVDTILVEAPGATNSPQEVIITLNLTEPPTLSVNPATLLFEGLEGGINNDVQNIYIENTGGGELNWSATYDESWLSVNPVSGTGPAVLDVEVDLTGLGAGTYIESIEIAATGANNSPQYVEVTLEVAEAPEIVLDQTLFNFSMTSQDPPVPDELNITNGGGSDLNWTASNLHSWLSISPASGTAPSTVSLTINSTGLGAGIYYDTITVSCPEATNTPQTAEVVLEFTNTLIEVPGDYSTIQAAINSAVTGDTILVDNGTYNEHLSINGKGLILISQYAFGGDDNDIINTIIDGGNTNRVLEIVECPGKVQGFTFINGYSDIGGAIKVGGCAINSDDSLVICNNIFTSNWDHAIFSWTSKALIRDNVFRDNSSDGAGGAIFCYDHDSSTISGNVFYDNICAVVGGAITCQATCYNVITNNTFYNNTCNTNGGAVNVVTASSAVIEMNIISQNSGGGIGAGMDATVSLSCNDVWNNTDGDDYIGCTPAPDDMSYDPLFCNPDEDDFGLFDTSPCAPANNDCGVLIGAKDVNCTEITYMCCDVTGDEAVNVSDAVFITNYVFIGGTPPDPVEVGDCTCDDNCNISDAVAIINYVFIGGYEPCDPDNDGIPDCDPNSP
ncbi:MAG: hypothetical protein GF310_05185 [candidate division Zixibacteria bacterium]|nr:hypothetical protein [candidate division Zixibacteria bacterium]